ncbi:MAG TPA: hypothetical protein VK024_07630 [Actinomycetaceae bacterium]|nr:hypothetical protein [Actinomycetaceae bacterium]
MANHPRRYLMCRPTHFTVSYTINPWMRPDSPTSTATAIAQWDTLRRTYLELGHAVDLIEPVTGLPDMVYAANGAITAHGTAYCARFKHEERAAEAPAYEAWLRAAGLRTIAAREVNEGEGDMLTVGDVVLAGTGFRTSHAAHLELQEAVGLPVVSLRLVDPRFYHLDTALLVLSDTEIAYYPPAFSPASREVLTHLFPDAIRAESTDALVFGLNGVSDGRHVVLPPQAARLGAAVAERGYDVLTVDVSELLKGGGGIKCCTLELRGAPEHRNS